MADLPAPLNDAGVLAYVAALLAWREGDEIPPKPNTLTIPVDELLAMLDDPAVRREVLLRLSVLVPHPRRKLRFRPGKGSAKGQTATRRG